MLGAIAWSKEHGYRWFDFTWIDDRAAVAVLRGEPLPHDLENSVASFKLAFGGAVTLLAAAYDYVELRALRAAVRRLAPLAYRLGSVRCAHTPSVAVDALARSRRGSSRVRAQKAA